MEYMKQLLDTYVKAAIAGIGFFTGYLIAYHQYVVWIIQ